MQIRLTKYQQDANMILQQIALKQHVWAIESYNYSNGTVKAARAICPGNLQTFLK